MGLLSSPPGLVTRDLHEDSTGDLWTLTTNSSFHDRPFLRPLQQVRNESLMTVCPTLHREVHMGRKCASHGRVLSVGEIPANKHLMRLQQTVEKMESSWNLGMLVLLVGRFTSMSQPVKCRSVMARPIERIPHAIALLLDLRP